MSAVEESLDLTLYGCPLHYIKAREVINKMELKQTILLIVNNGDAVEEIMTSLRHDQQQCETVSIDTLTTTIRVVKKHGGN